MSPFVTLPKAPTLPHNYATIPSTLPPSILSSPASASQSNASAGPDAQLPAYVTSASGFRAHPNAIVAQNRALRQQLDSSSADARASFRSWLDSIKERELAEKRRKAPGWLDSDEKMLRPEKPAGAAQSPPESASAATTTANAQTMDSKPIDTQVNDLGAQMDRAFG